MSKGEFILYKTQDGSTQVTLRVIKKTFWLIQEEIAQLFDKGRSTIAEHIKNILQDSELSKNSVCRDFQRADKCRKLVIKSTTEESSVIQKTGSDSKSNIDKKATIKESLIVQNEEESRASHFCEGHSRFAFLRYQCLED